MKTITRFLGISLAALPVWVAGAADVPDSQPAANASQPATENQTQATAETAKPSTTPAVETTWTQSNKRPLLLSYGTEQIMRLIEAKVDNTVIKAYVENSVTTSPPSAEEIIYLRDRGLPSDILTLLIKRGYQIQNQAVQANKEAAAAAAAAQAAATVTANNETATYDAAPSQVEEVNIQSSPTTVYYDYPVDSYVGPYDYYYYNYGVPLLFGPAPRAPLPRGPRGPAVGPRPRTGPTPINPGPRPGLSGPGRSGPGPAVRSGPGIGGGGPRGGGPGGRPGGGPAGGGPRGGGPGGGPGGGGGGRGGGPR